MVLVRRCFDGVCVTARLADGSGFVAQHPCLTVVGSRVKASLAEF